MPLEFNKHQAIQVIKKMSPPTPTDRDHPAHWWNEQFGQKIKNSVMGMLKELIKEYDKMYDPTEFVGRDSNLLRTMTELNESLKDLSKKLSDYIESRDKI